jgi:hypothetical protein
VLGEEVIRFMQELELLRIASAPFAEAAVKAKPEPRANGQWTVFRPGTSFTPVRIHRLHIAMEIKLG